MEKEWYEQAIQQGCLEYVLEDFSFIIYKGFKLIKESNTYSILDTRFSDLYTKLKPSNRKELEQKGFITGCDCISNSRNEKRIEKLEFTIMRLYGKLIELETNEVIDSKKHQKKLNNIERNLADNEDLLSFYKAKRKQFKNKYNGKTN